MILFLLVTSYQEAQRRRYISSSSSPQVLNMRFTETDPTLPKFHVCEAEVSGQQAVLHPIVLAADSVPKLQQAGGLEAILDLGVRELCGWGALCCC